MTRLLGNRDYYVDNRFTLADIAAATATAYLAVRWTDFDVRDAYPALARHSDLMETRPSFEHSRPVPQTISDRVV
jgi:glutathione S-transferase